MIHGAHTLGPTHVLACAVGEVSMKLDLRCKPDDPCPYHLCIEMTKQGMCGLVVVEQLKNTTRTRRERRRAK